MPSDLAERLYGEPPVLPRFSSSEEVAFKACRLAHHFKYDLGYDRVFINRKLSLGITVHKGLEAYYWCFDWANIKGGLDLLAEMRWEEIVEAKLADDAQVKKDFDKDKALALAMVKGYINWVNDEGLDDEYEVVGIEKSALVTIPEACAVLPVKMDLIQRSTITERLRIVDFKTAAQFSVDLTKYQLSEQNGNYNLAVLAIYDELATEFAYRELRKIVPSGRSKPPYFREILVYLTPEEMLSRIENYKATAADRFDPDRNIYPNPSACCGSWKNDWQPPCLKVGLGMTPLEALEASEGYAPSDPYERYASK